MRRGGGGLGKKVGGRLANKVSTINGVGECKAFIFATVIYYCLQNKRFSNTVFYILVCHTNRRYVYTPGLANLNASRPFWRHRGGPLLDPLEVPGQKIFSFLHDCCALKVFHPMNQLTLCLPPRSFSFPSAWCYDHSHNLHPIITSHTSPIPAYL